MIETGLKERKGTRAAFVEEEHEINFLILIYISINFYNA